MRLRSVPPGYYRWRSRKPSARDQEDRRLVEQIKAAHVESRGIYGSPKIYRKLRRDGEAVNHKRVERLMKGEGIKAKRVKKSKRTTDSRHSLPVAGNVLAREFKAARPRRGLDFGHHLRLDWEGWLYLVVFLDLYSRLVVGWAVSETLRSSSSSGRFCKGKRGAGWPSRH